jgi:hypothetical protein
MYKLKNGRTLLMPLPAELSTGYALFYLFFSQSKKTEELVQVQLKQ